MLYKLFNLPVFLISLLIGLLFIYISEPETNNIYIYPTPYNFDKFEYIDIAGNCFDFLANKLNCPSDLTKIKTIPIQTIQNKK